MTGGRRFVDAALERWNCPADVFVYGSGGGLALVNRNGSARRASMEAALENMTGRALFVRVAVSGFVESGSGVSFVPVTGGTEHYPIPLNSVSRLVLEPGAGFRLKAEIGAEARALVRELSIELMDECADLAEGGLIGGGALLVTPTYPSSHDRYLSGFTHSRAAAYLRRGLPVGIVCSYFHYDYQTVYDFEGVRVLRCGMEDLARIIGGRGFGKILVHFFDHYYANALDRALKNRDTPLVFFCHGPETLFYDMSAMAGPYFSRSRTHGYLTPEVQRRILHCIEKYNSYDRVKWVFVSEWMRRRSEKLLGIAFRESEVIPNFIDPEQFRFVSRTPEMRRRIMVIRRFDNERKYAVDIAVRTVLELSSRPVFSELEFGFYGDGDYFDELTAPLKNFKNVRLFRGFLDHAAVSRIHGEYGVALLPTRLDSQCVSVLEAAASGLVVVSSDTSAVPEFIPRELGTLAATENPAEYAGIIERLQADPGLFKSLGRRFAEAAEERCSFGKTVEREMELIAREERYRKRSRPDYGKTPEKVLTVVVPVYNMEDRLERCARSMLDGNDCRSLDMLIIDDGSTDGSAAVADGLAERHPGVVRVVRKENGGHGSVINRGLAEALGRYFRVVDSDDWVDSRNFGLFLSRLEGEDADAVITDFSEDWDGNPLLKPSEIYSNLEPFQAYSFNTLAEGKYGFEHWGPVLPSSTFRTGSLRKAALHLDEGIAYVDMEYAALSLACVESLRYYDLDVYRYSLGREGQTVSRVSYERKFKDHERVIVRIAEHLAGGGLAEGKRKYVLNNILLPLVNGHFLILTEYLGDEGEMEKFIGTIGRYPFLRDPAERQRRLMESRRTETARPAAAEKEGILSALGSMTLSALPFVFVSSMSPEVRKSGLRMIKHAVNYFVPYGVVTRYSMLKSALKGGRKPGAPNR